MGPLRLTDLRIFTGALALLVIATGALAQSPPAHAESESEYNAIIKKALLEFDLGHWSEARAFFSRAHALSPNARTLRGIGLASYEMRDYVAALVALRGALVNQTRQLTAEMQAQVKTQIEDAEGFVAHYVLALEPKDAGFQVDGEPGTFDTDGTLILDPGDHVLSVEKTGFLKASRTLSVAGNERGELHFTLSATTKSAAQAPPMAASDTPPQPKLSAAAASAPLSTPRWVGLGLAGAGVIAVGLGVTFSVLALNERSTSMRSCQGDQCDASGLRHRDAALSRADAATVSFVAAGALLAAGALVFWLEPGGEHPVSAVRVQPIAAPGIAGLSARGAF